LESQFSHQQLGGFVVYEVGKGVQVAAAEQPAKAL
jgi:hypothetical protein